MSFLVKAKALMNENPDKVESISDTLLGKGGDLADKATGGKYSDKIDGVQVHADNAVGESTDTTGQEPTDTTRQAEPGPDAPPRPTVP